MKLTIKCLKGGTAVADVNEETTILELKKKIESDIKIPANQQTLVLFGKTLQDDKTIASYPKIKDGTRIYVAVKKVESLNVVLERFLRQYYSEEQCKLIVDEFMKNFNAKVDNLSLDDLERIALADKDSLAE